MTSVGNGTTAMVEQLFTHGDPLLGRTLLTHYVTTPVELALTPLDTRHFQGRVAATAAHRLAVINTVAAAVAVSSVRARDVIARFGFAKVRRLLEIHQVAFVHGFAQCFCRLEARSARV